MSTTLIALFLSLMVSGVSNLYSTYLTVSGSALCCVMFFVACVLRSNSRLHLVLLVAAVTMCLLCLMSSESNVSRVFSTVDILLCYAALVGLCATTEDLGPFCRRLMLFSYLIPVAIVLGQTLRNGTIQSWKIGGLGMSPNYIAAHINMTLPLLVAYASTAKPVMRNIIWLSILCGAFAVICVGSRNGIGTLAGMIVLFGLFNHKRTAIFTAAVIVLILIFADEIMQNQHVYQLLARFRLVGFEAKTTRTMIWSISFRYIEAAPWLGIGPGGSEKALTIIDINHAHNNVIQIALECGIPAALLYVFINARLLLIPGLGLLSTRTAFLASLPVVAYFMVSLTDNTIHHPETTLLLVACIHEARRVLLGAEPEQQAVRSTAPLTRVASPSTPPKVPAFSRSTL